MIFIEIQCNTLVEKPIHIIFYDLHEFCKVLTSYCYLVMILLNRVMVMGLFRDYNLS